MSSGIEGDRMFIRAGKALQQMRENCGMTREVAAKKIPIAIKFLAKIEKGQYQKPSHPKIAGMANAYDVSEEEITSLYECSPDHCRAMLARYAATESTQSEPLAPHPIQSSPRIVFTSNGNGKHHEEPAVKPSAHSGSLVIDGLSETERCEVLDYVKFIRVRKMLSSLV